MYKKVSATIAIICVFLCFGCSKTTKQEKRVFFDPETQFIVGFRTNYTQTKARLFFDQNGFLHLLHEDTASPLFGLEEIFSGEGVKSYFHELEYENSPYFGGSATIYRALLAIQNENHISEETKDGVTTYVYQTKELDFSFHFEKSTRKPIQIFGKDKGVEFDINFNMEA